MTFSDEHRQVLQKTLQKNAIPLLQLSTTDNVVGALQSQLGNRVTAAARATGL